MLHKALTKIPGIIEDDRPRLLDAPLQSRVKGSALSCYMEDEKGEGIPESVRRRARNMARAYWHKLVRDEKAPASAGKVPLDVKNKFINLMELS